MKIASYKVFILKVKIVLSFLSLLRYPVYMRKCLDWSNITIKINDELMYTQVYLRQQLKVCYTFKGQRRKFLCMTSYVHMCAFACVWMRNDVWIKFNESRKEDWLTECDLSCWYWNKFQLLTYFKVSLLNTRY